MPTNKKKIMVYVSDSEYQEIRKLAKEKGCSMSRILSGSVYAYLKWRSVAEKVILLLDVTK